MNAPLAHQTQSGPFFPRLAHSGNRLSSSCSRLRIRLAHALAITILAVSSSATAATTAKTWCANRCDQIVSDWNLQTHEVIKAAEGYRTPMAASTG